MWRGHCHPRLCAAVLACVWLSPALPSAAQLRAGTTIAVTAKLPSSVTLSDNLLPLTIVVANGAASVDDIPFKLKWNVNPRESTGFRITATLTGTTLPTGSMELRIAGATFRHLPSSNSIVLMNKPITSGNRQGEQQSSIELRVPEAAASQLADGVYTGWLKLEAQLL